jgi:hypothetical protein
MDVEQFLEMIRFDQQGKLAKLPGIQKRGRNGFV